MVWGMTETVFATPFFHAVIDDTGDTEVIFSKGGIDRAFYVCDDAEDADKATRAINLLWQAITYGIPDPAYKKEFTDAFGPDAYGADAVQKFAGAMVAIGAIPGDFHERAVH